MQKIHHVRVSAAIVEGSRKLCLIVRKEVEEEEEEQRGRSEEKVHI